MAYRFNPAPGWPAPPEGWTPPEGWQPDPAWPPAPEGWEFWVWEETAATIPPAAAEHHAPPTAEPEPNPEPAPEPAEPDAPQGEIPPVEATASGLEEAPAPAEPPSPEGPGNQWQQAEPAPASDPLPPVVQPEAPAESHATPAEEPTSTDTSAGGVPAAAPAVPEQHWPQTAPPADPAPAPDPVPQASTWGEPAGQSGAWGGQEQHQQPQQYAHQAPSHQHGAHQHGAQQQGGHPHAVSYQSSPPPTRPKKKGKGLLVFLIVLAVILAGLFVWGLMSGLRAESSAVPAPVQEAAAPDPTEDAAAEEPEAVEPEETVPAEPEVVEAEAEGQDLEEMAIAAGLHDLLAFYDELDIVPADLGPDPIALEAGESAEVLTIMVGPAGTVSDLEVGTLAVDEVEFGWSNTDSPMPCPPPQGESEYVKLQLSANTAPALHDYPFTGVELRFFDAGGNETGTVNPLLTALCLGDFGAMSNAWQRDTAIAGGVLAMVGPKTTTVAYSAAWGYGINDTVYAWDLAAF